MPDKLTSGDGLEMVEERGRVMRLRFTLAPAFSSVLPPTPIKSALVRRLLPLVF